MTVLVYGNGGSLNHPLGLGYRRHTYKHLRHEPIYRSSRDKPAGSILPSCREAQVGGAYIGRTLDGSDSAISCEFEALAACSSW